MPNSPGNSDMRRTVWIDDLLYEAQAEMYFTKMGQMSTKEEGGKGIILFKKDLKKVKGEKIRMAFSPFLTGTGVTGDNELEGQEEQMSVYTQDVNINQLRHAVRLEGNMDEKKTAYSLRTQAKWSLKTWFARRWEQEIFYKLSGVTAQTFSNTPTVPTTYRNLFGGNATATTDIDTGDALDTDVISRAKVQAKTEVSGVPIIQSLNLPRGVNFVLFVHEYQAYALKKDSVWMQANREANVRGEKNPLFQDAVGMWDGVLVVPHPFVQTYSTWGSGGATPGARALLVGREACCIALGKGASWVEKYFDYANQWAIAVGAIWGLQKTKFNDIDYGCIAVDTYAVNPNA